MKYILVFMLALLPFHVFAEEAETSENVNIIHTPEYIPQEEIVDPNIPACNDEKLIEAIKKEVSQYLAKQSSGSIIAKRNRNLVMKYLDTFNEKDVENFDNQENYLVADTLIMLKLNKRISSKNIRLCVTEGKKTLYILIYPEDFRYNVEIINLNPSNSSKGNFSFLYTPKLKQYQNFED